MKSIEELVEEFEGMIIVAEERNRELLEEINLTNDLLNGKE